MKKLLFSIVSTMVFVAILFFTWNKNNGGNNYWMIEKFYLGKAYASSSINVPIFRGSAIITVEAGRFLAYYDENGDVRVVFIGKDEQISSFIVKTKLPENLLGDGHCAISLGYTCDGYVHIIYGAHDTRPYYFSFLADKDTIIRFENQSPDAEQWADPITYPQFYRISDSDWLVYRYGADIYIKEYDAFLREWALKYNGPILTADGVDSVYVDKLAVEGKTIKLSWVYRLPDTSGEVVNDGIYSIQSDDKGQTWRDVAGNNCNIPIKRGFVSKIIDIPDGVGLINQNTAFAKDGLHYLAVLRQSGNDGLFQIFLYVISKDGKVCVREVSDNKTEFSLNGRGTLSLPLSRPQILVSDKNVHVIYRQDKKIVIASVPVRDVCSDAWSYYQLDEKFTDNWEPNYDPISWTDNRELAMYVQASRQGPDDTAVKGEANPAYLFELKEK